MTLPGHCRAKVTFLCAENGSSPGVTAQALGAACTDPSPCWNCRLAPLGRKHKNVTLPIDGVQPDVCLHKAVTIATVARLRGGVPAARAVVHTYNNSPIAKLAAIRAQTSKSRPEYESGM